MIMMQQNRKKIMLSKDLQNQIIKLMIIRIKKEIQKMIQNNWLWKMINKLKRLKYMKMNIKI